MRVTHDVALLYISVLLEKAGDFLFGEAWVNARHEKVRPWVAGTFFVLVSGFGGGTAGLSQ